MKFRRALLDTISHIGKFKTYVPLPFLIHFMFPLLRRFSAPGYTPASKAETTRANAASFPVPPALAEKGRRWDDAVALLRLRHPIGEKFSHGAYGGGI